MTKNAIDTAAAAGLVKVTHEEEGFQWDSSRDVPALEYGHTEGEAVPCTIRLIDRVPGNAPQRQYELCFIHADESETDAVHLSRQQLTALLVAATQLMTRDVGEDSDD